MSKTHRSERRIATTLGIMIAASLFSALAATPILSISSMAFAQPSKEAPFKGNITGSIVSEPGKDQGKTNATSNMGGNASANENTTASERSNASYKSSYPKERADEKNPFTLNAEKHLYKPGEEVTIEGSILASLINEIGGNISSIMLNVTDNKGNVTVGQKEVDVNNGEFTTSFQLPPNAEQGSYRVNAIIEVKANILDTLSADVKSKMETSARFEVISPNAFAVKAQDGRSFSLEIASNSTISNPEFKQDEKKISFHVEGQTGTRGVTDITIPKALLSGQLTVSIDGKVIPPESSDVVTIEDTNEGTTLEINYHHSEHTIEVSGTNVVPEFPLPIVGATAAVIGAIAIIGRSRLLRQKI